MSILGDLFGKKKEAKREEPAAAEEAQKQPEKRHTFDELDQAKASLAKAEKAAEVAKLKALTERYQTLERIQKERALKDKIAEMESDLYGDEEEEEEEEEEQPEDNNDLLKIGAAILAGMQANKQQPPAQQAGPAPIQRPEVLELSDEDITRIISSIPKNQLALAQKMEDSTLLNLIKSRFPALSDSTAKRGLELLKKTDLKAIKNVK